MSKCPNCGNPLEAPTGDTPPVCRSCVISQLMDDPDTFKGSSDADDYEIITEIGRGGDGTVYLATDLNGDRRVAIKLINTLSLSNEITTRRFHAEADAIASLDHPHIVPIFASGEMDSRPFYTMKYFKGGNLAEHMGEYSTP